MKVIDAFWEKRNLGLDTVEFEIESNDSCELIKSELEQNEKEYNVVKIGFNSYDVSSMLTKMGYVYTESMFHLVHNLKDVRMNSIQKRLSDSITYVLMNEEDRAELYSEIRKGMFDTDRIALNPLFGIEIGNRRYINWIEDEVQRNTQIFKMQYKDESIGFFGYKEIEEGVYFPFLAGMYGKYVSSGLGLGIVTKPIEESIKRNARYNSTYVSSNNLKALSLHLALGFRIDNISYVFCKIGDKKC